MALWVKRWTDDRVVQGSNPADTKSRRSLLSGVHPRGSKRSHQSALEMCNSSWTPHSSLEKDNSKPLLAPGPANV